MSADRFAAITRFVEHMVHTLPLSGACLMLLKDGEIVYQRAFGGYTLDRVLPVASATKWVTGAVIAALIERGALYLDDTVGDYIEAFAGEKSSITLRHLMAHTSGLPHTDAPCLKQGDLSLEACVAWIAQLPLLAPPGQVFAYGENSFQVAGRMAEVATGRRWDELVRELLAAPLGWRNSTYFGTGTSTANPRLGSGLRTTAREYAAFLSMLLSGGSYRGARVLSAETIALMGEDHALGAPVLASPNLFTHRGYGLGCWRDEADAQGRAWQLSSPGAFGCTPWVDFRHRLGGVLMVRDSYHRIAPLAKRLQEQVREALG
ncbi:MAG: serine hydrolase domain-containing protein [Anaerolineae bacterium]|nr:serine hydrolase domain-containing protein [Anaerolineae bacterium]MDW8291601.1 serine hydrolase domain-containing protein [Anaerolineae bacterium]